MVKHCSTLKMLYNLSIAICIICHVHGISSGGVHSKKIVQKLQLNHRNGISSQSFCPENRKSFIIGATVRYPNFLNQLSVTINEIEFICSDAISTRAPSKGTLRLQKDVGNLTRTEVCPNGGFVTGLNLYMDHGNSYFWLSNNNYVVLSLCFFVR